MQKDNRGTVASLMAQIGSPRPFGNLGFAGEHPSPAVHMPDRCPGESIGGVRETRPLCFCYPSACPYHPFIIASFSRPLS